MVDSKVKTWDDTKWQGYGLLAGVVFVIAQVVSIAVTGQPPARDASAEKIAEYFVKNDSGIKLSGILFGFSLIFGLLFLGSLWRVISHLESKGPRLAFVAAVGFVMSGLFAGGAQVMFIAPALRVDTLSGAGEFAWAVGYVGFAFALAAISAHMLAICALTMRSGFLPSWTGWIAALGALVSAVGVVAAGTESAAFTTIGLIGFALWLLWTLIASVLLFKRNT
ncbi:hypothetical protein BH10ACT2_BH10ACT2_18070 [soil metagenome]